LSESAGVCPRYGEFTGSLRTDAELQPLHGNGSGRGSFFAPTGNDPATISSTRSTSADCQSRWTVQAGKTLALRSRDLLCLTNSRTAQWWRQGTRLCPTRKSSIFVRQLFKKQSGLRHPAFQRIFSRRLNGVGWAGPTLVRRLTRSPGPTGAPSQPKLRPPILGEGW
jgi:hypothetical protein